MAFGFLAVFFAVPAFADKATLESISEKQDRILRTLEEIKSELNVVKVRVSG